MFVSAAAGSDHACFRCFDDRLGALAQIIVEDDHGGLGQRPALMTVPADEPPGFHVALAFHVDEPIGSVTKSSRKSSQVGRVIWISSDIPCDSMRLAMFTVSPQRS